MFQTTGDEIFAKMNAAEMADIKVGPEEFCHTHADQGNLDGTTWICI